MGFFSYGAPKHVGPTAEQLLDGRFMKMYQEGLDQQAKILKKEKKKAKEIQGLESKLRDPQSELTENQEALLKQLQGDPSMLNPEWRGHTLQKPAPADGSLNKFLSFNVKELKQRMDDITELEKRRKSMSEFDYIKLSNALANKKKHQFR